MKIADKLKLSVGEDPDFDWSSWFGSMAEQARHSAVRDYYAGGMISGSTPLSDVPFVALDFETTGLNAKQDDIVSIGLVPFTLQRVYCRHARHWLVQPKTSLSDESVTIHGIRHSDLNRAPSLIHLLEPLLQDLAGKVVVVHYRYIERHFLYQILHRRLNERLIFPLVDTMQIEADIRHQGLRAWWNRVSGGKVASLRLANCRTRYGLPGYTAHHALTDALATAELFQAQVAHYINPDDPVSTYWR
ncbi:exonuclease family protein [Oleiphilus messinensis]|uniref:Exonuclease family protein n=1 Tax=Oleiphilus messinensis TaxID=141451 RepID=A0A1Y0I1W4_9GAMM|nr:3'-5' exonuclease [Oleiphilus messinensis]ARU54391.1 exonuclease family protein [Oleiphilus messinensis]